MNKIKMIKADYIFIIMTFCHGLITFLFLGGMPGISFGVLSTVTLTAFLLWTFYDGGVYLLICRWIMETNISGKHILFAIMFGIGSAFIRGILDWGNDKIAYYTDGSFLLVVFREEVITWFFGMIMLFLLFKKTGYEKNTVWKEIKVPFIMLIVVIAIYFRYVLSALWIKERGIESTQLTEGQISNWDYIVAVSLAKFNPWLYVAFFLVFWWLMRKMFPKKKNANNNTKNL